MSTRAKHLAIAAAVLMALGGLRPAAGGARSQPLAPLPAAGPRAREIPAGVTIADDAASLAALLADARGPAEIWLRPGLYRGDFTVRRPIALRGAGGAVIEGTGAGTVLTIEASDVLVENLVVRHSGRRHTAEDAGIKAKGDRVRLADLRVEDTLFGVSLQLCHGCAIERVHVEGPGDAAELRGDGIKLWEADDTTVRGCTVDRSRDVVVWYAKRVLLEDNTVRRSRYGTHFMHATDSVVRGSRIHDDVVGIFVMYSTGLVIEGNVLAGARGAAGVGIGFKESDRVALRRNWLVANTTGTYLDHTPRTPDAPVVFEGNVIALNDVALRVLGEQAGATFRGNDFHENAVVVEADGGGDALAVALAGNHFTDYAGYDLDHDGRGDVAYEVTTLSGQLTDARPELAFFHGTAAMGLIDAIAHAVPVFSKRKLLVDPQPAMRAPEMP
ncbi:MAG: nitrous oxide reductase family maturation protein NosD [Minicystis sp.]